MFAIFKNYDKMQEFTCDMCQRVLKKAWSDKDAIAEMNRKYRGTDTSDTMVVCDDCMNL
jgi:hypothetical protein